MSESAPELPSQLRRIVLIGFSATGKSVLAPYIADRLGWRAIDLDHEIERQAGRSIPAIFEQDGEAGFRERERAAAREAALVEGAVIATGGGLWLDPANRAELATGGFVVTLEARSTTILARYAETEQARTEVRPLLAGADPRRRVETLKAQRQPFYALADLTIHTDELEIGELVDEIVGAVERGAARTLASDSRLRAMREGPGIDPPPVADFGPDVACIVDAGSSRYPVYTAWDLLQPHRRHLRSAQPLAPHLPDRRRRDPRQPRRDRGARAASQRPSGLHLARHARRGEQIARLPGSDLRLAGDPPRRALRHDPRGRRRRHDRPRGRRRRHLPARHADGPRSHHDAGHGRRLNRRQGRDRPARRQEPGRRVLPAPRRRRRPLNARHAAQSASCAPATPR